MPRAPLFVVLALAVRPSLASAQQLPPRLASLVPPAFGDSARGPARSVASTLRADVRASASPRASQWLEGGLILAIPMALAVGSLGNAFCHDADSGGSGNCLFSTVSATAFGATLGFSIGALVGGQFPKRGDAPAP
jgi:hypothetical protein